MKNVLLFGFGLLLSAVAIGFYMRPSTPLVTSPLEIATSSMFTLHRIKGEVFYKKDGDNNFSVMGLDTMKLPSTTTVKTANGKAYVLFEDTSVITLKEDTEIVVTISDKNISIKQMFGKTYHRVETLLTGKTYEVRTPTTLAAVRGTKFVVSHDAVKKETKIAVTESNVAVIGMEDMNSTSTAQMNDFMLVEEGQTATIDGAQTSNQKEKDIILTKTENENDMKELIDDEVIMDEVFKTLKQSSAHEEFRQKIEEEMMKEEERKNLETKETLPSSQMREEIKNETKEEEKKPLVKEVVKEEIKKLSEEVFFGKFEPLFMRLFYIDDQMTPCSFSGKAEDRVMEIVSLARDSGYPITSTFSLTAFAKDITEYCSTKKESMKGVLQKRFDEEYPYQE